MRRARSTVSTARSTPAQYPRGQARSIRVGTNFMVPEHNWPKPPALAIRTKSPFPRRSDGNSPIHFGVTPLSVVKYPRPLINPPGPRGLDLPVGVDAGSPLAPPRARRHGRRPLV